MFYSSQQENHLGESTDMYLCPWEGDRCKGKGPTVFVAEIGLITFTSIQHLFIGAEDHYKNYHESA